MTDNFIEPIKPKAESNRKIDYRCDNCQKEANKTQLKVKRVQFKEMGQDGTVILTRTISWLCLNCMEADPDFNRPAFAASPGLRDTTMSTDARKQT